MQISEEALLVEQMTPAAVASSFGFPTHQQRWMLGFTRRYECNFLMKYALRIGGALQIPLLRECLSELVRRHDALRTTFPIVGGVVTRQVSEPAEFALTVVDVSGESCLEEARAAAQGGIEELFREFFDLQAGPLFQARLWRVSAEEHVLAVAAHHIIFDATSAAIVFREMWKLYAQLVSGSAPGGTGAPAQYSDYAAWQSRADRAWPREHEPYWRETLAGASPVHLPPDSDLEHIAPYTMAPLKVVFGADISARLTELARQQRVMVAMVVLTLYAAVLGRWSSRRDVLLPYNVTGRGVPAHNGIVGMLAHTIPIRVLLPEGDTFIQTVQRTCRSYYAALAHPDYGRIGTHTHEYVEGTPVQWSSRSPRELLGIPGSADTSAPAGLRIEPFRFNADRSTGLRLQQDLHLSFINGESGIGGYGSYRADLFRPETMQRFAESLRGAAAHVGQSPDCEMRTLLWGSYA